MQLTQTQKEKLRKILEVQEFGDMALLKLLVNLEEKVEEIPVNTQKDLEELRILLQKGRKTTLKEKQKVAELTAKLLTKEEVAEEVLKRISLEEIAKKVQVPKPKDGKDAVVDYSLLKKWIVANTPEIDIEEIKREVKEELQEMMPTVPEVVDNIPIVGEKVRDALELIYEEDEKLKMEAIGKLPEKIKELETKIEKTNARGGGIAGINRIAEDGSIKWTGTGIINFGAGLDVTPTNHGVTVTTDQTEEVVDYIQFNTTATPLTNAEGLLQWNATDGTLDLGMSGGDIRMQIGQEMFMKVRNVSGSLIPNGTPVYVSGRTGNRPNIYPAKSDAESTSMVIGITTQDISSPADGFVTTFGYVRQIKTDYAGWTEGDKLYVSKTTAGELTNVEPTAPHHSDVVATVEIVGGAGIGSILVNINQHKTLDELSDVDGSAPDATGDLLTYNTGGTWERNAYNITDYLKRDQTTPQTTVGTFTFPILKVGANGTNSSITKYGNTVGDEFFVGTTGAFRVQRAGSGSEAFRVQINGDTEGRWLGTSSGVLKWGDGTNTQDTNLYRNSADNLKTDDTFTALSVIETTPTLLKLDQTTPDTTVGTFTFPQIKDSGLTATRVVFVGTDGLLQDTSALTLTSAGLLTLTGTATTDGIVVSGKYTVTEISGTGNQVGSAVSIAGGNGGTNTVSSSSPAGGGFTFTSGGGGTNSGSGAVAVGGAGGAFAITTGNGGNNSGTGSSVNIGGAGGNVTLTTGNGGISGNTSGSSNIGGAGGNYTVTLGVGGAGSAGKTGGVGGALAITAGIGGNTTASSAGTNTGGAGGANTFAGGRGGHASSGATNVGGIGGAVSFTGGKGGNATGTLCDVGDGGSLSFTGGATGDSNAGNPSVPSTSGGLTFTVGSASTSGAWGNHAGNISFVGVNGSTAARAGVATTGGNGSVISFTSGSGGNASSGTSNTGGNAGDYTFTAGIGGTGATANGLNGHFIFKSGSTEIARFDNTAGAVGRFGIGTGATVSAKLHVICGSGCEQQRVGYDASNYASTTVSSTGLVTLDAVGTGSEFLFSDRVRHPGTFGNIHVHDSGAGAQSIPTGTTYTKLTPFTDDGFCSNVTCDATNDKITFTKTGIYKVSCQLSFSCGTNNVEWAVAGFLNGTEQDQAHFKRKIGTAGDMGSASFVGIIDVTTANWDLDVRARHDNGSAVNITVQYGQLVVEYLGET